MIAGRMRISACVAILGLLPGAVSMAAEPVGIRNNPFSRPSIDLLVVDTAALDSLDQEPSQLDLRITLVAGKNGFANIGGNVLKVGDQAQGYTLVRVYEDRAEFLKGDDRLVVFVRDDVEGKNERRDK